MSPDHLVQALCCCGYPSDDWSSTSYSDEAHGHGRKVLIENFQKKKV